MALTATAIKQAVATVKRQLAVDNPIIMGINPNWSSIKYVVKPWRSLLVPFPVN